MTILSREILPKNGPYIVFADCPLELDLSTCLWPEKALYEEFIFFEMADDLLFVLCSTTESCSFFDHYKLTRFFEPDSVLTVAAGFLQWAICLTQKKASKHFSYSCLEYSNNKTAPTEEQLRHDLIETLLFLSSHLNQIAYKKRSLLIVGI